MEHGHTVYDTDTHFVIDPITRAITNSESKKNLLIQNDHNSEEFTFEIDKVVEGHDMTLCNRVEIHYSNVDSTKRNSSLGVYEVNDLTENEDGSKITFTWVVSENATFYAGTLSFLIKFICVENGVITYRWNTAVNNSITIAKGMQNGEAIAEAYPDILNQWKEELFSAVYGYKTIQIGPVEPNTYPYIWFDTSYSDNQNVGMITVKNIDGIVQVISPMVSMNAIHGLVEKFDSKADRNHEHDMNDVLGLQGALNNKSNADHTHTPASIGAASLDENGVVRGTQNYSYMLWYSTQNRTLQESDVGRTLMPYDYLDQSKNYTITVPTHKDVAIIQNAEIAILRYYPGDVTITPANGVDLRYIGVVDKSRSVRIANRYGMVVLKKISNANWLVTGDVEEVV